MKPTHAKVSPSGRLSLPAGMRKSLGLEHGGNVVIELVGPEIRIRTVDEVVKQAQALSRRLLAGKPEGSLAAFLAERRREAERE